MEERLKERLTGAILLVLLVVVLVPAMFRGERPGAAGTVSPAGAGAQQVYTIDLQGAVPAAPDPGAEASQPATLPAEAPAATEGPDGAAPSSPASPTRPVEREAAAPQPAAAAARAGAPTTTDPGAKPVTEPRAASQTKAASEAKPASQPKKPADARALVSKPAAAAGTGFIVQVGSFSKRENAAIMVKQAARKGARLTVAGPDDRGLFRVRSAVVRTRQEAVALQEKLQSQGFKGTIGSVN